MNNVDKYSNLTAEQTTWIGARRIEHTVAHGCVFFERGDAFIEVTARGIAMQLHTSEEPMLLAHYDTVRAALLALAARPLPVRAHDCGRPYQPQHATYCWFCHCG